MAYIVGADRNQIKMVTTSLDSLIDEDNSVRVIDAYVDSLDLIELGFAPGPKLGQCLEMLLRLVQEDAIPNEKEALLRKAKESLL